jgi:transcriptional antiterminator NusG
MADKRWYILHTLSGAEDKVKAGLESRIASEPGMKDLVDRIVIPKEQVTEVKRGQRKTSERKFFPGYILIHMEMNDASWLFVKNIPGVTSFIGSKREPTFIPDEDVEKILLKTEETKDKPSAKFSYEVGDSVMIIEGPFVNFTGEVEEVNSQKGKLKVSVSIFGRSTPVELEFWQVEKV